RLFGSTVGGCFEVCISETASTAGDNPKLVIGSGEIVQQLTGLVVIDDGSARNSNIEIFSVLAAPVAAHAMLSAFSFKRMLEAKFEQRIFVGIRNQIDIATVATVASAGSAARNKFFPPESDA